MKQFFPALSMALFVLTLAVLPSVASAATRTLTIGMSGADVKSMQSNLMAQGYLAPGRNTGTFGKETLAAVKKFQCAQKITCSGSSYGVVGPKTQAALVGGATESTTAGSSVPVASGGFEVGGWIPYWRTATGTQDVLPHLANMTEISPFGFTMKSNGTLYDAANITAEPWTSFIAAAKKAKVRVVPTVMWGDGETIHAILSNSTARVALEDEIAATVKANGYDGIDIDFESKLAETNTYFATFLKGLSQRLGTKWLYCSIEARTPLDSRYDSTPPPDATQYANDYAAIGKYCDRVEIMAYDQGAIDVKLNRARAAPYIPVADPAWVQKVLQVAADSIPKNKIILGMATYGYEYSVTPLSEYGYRYDRQWAFNPRYGVELAAQLGISPVRNSAGELSFIYKPTVSTANFGTTTLASTTPNTTTTNTPAIPSTIYSQATIASQFPPPFNIVDWSDSQAIQDKVNIAKSMGIRGVALFKLDGGEDQNIWNVLPKGAH
jgi:spore germination protein YaaH